MSVADSPSTSSTDSTPVREALGARLSRRKVMVGGLAAAATAAVAVGGSGSVAAAGGRSPRTATVAGAGFRPMRCVGLETA